MRSIFSALVLFGVAACTVGPDYRRPAPGAASGNWIAPMPPGQVDERWWERLGDPLLDQLVERAITANPDVREAEARLREARANRDAAAGRALPEVKAGGSATEQQISENGQLPVGNIPGLERRFSLYDVGFDASWEIDFWGGARRSVEAAGGRQAAAAYRVSDIRLQTIAEVVRTYAELRSAQERIRLLGDEAAVRSEIDSLMALRHRAGESSRLESETARQRSAAARAAQSAAGPAERAALYRLSLLTGQPPEALLAALSPRRDIPVAPAFVVAGVRSELLQRRPDVLAAEAELAAATADIGVETANLYPRFSLVGSFGQQARRPGDLADSDSTRFSVGPSFSWPIFSFGRIRAQIRGADARADAASARYEKAVLGALADSETAANRFGGALGSLDRRREAAENGRTGLGLARLRYERGEDNKLQYLEAKSAQSAAEQALVDARSEALLAYVAFSKSLGGGQIRPSLSTGIR
jgi:NodT family efflux transporter outer membrane factor (OMF) lipoprotein